MAALRGNLKGRSLARIVTACALVGIATLLAACGGDKGSDKAKQAAAAAPSHGVVTTSSEDSADLRRIRRRSTPRRRSRSARVRVAEAQPSQCPAIARPMLWQTRAGQTSDAQAKAQLEVAMARLGKTETDERRLKPLAERRAVPQQDYDDAAANLLSAKAGVSAAKSQVEEAELSLSYCTIKSPIKGLIGKRLVAPGNLVGKGEATLLDTVSSIDPIRVNVTISEAEYLKYFGQQQKQGARTPSRSGLELVLADGSVYPYKGKFVIVDRAVDLKTARSRSSASFRPPGALRCRPIRTRACERGCGRERHPGAEAGHPGNPGMKSVLVVGADNMVALRTIRPGETVGDMQSSRWREAG
jgi:membrane fusion protein (multidrug efflux system)